MFTVESGVLASLTSDGVLKNLTFFFFSWLKLCSLLDFNKFTGALGFEV